MRHRPELDGLRGIAILLVLGAHTDTPGVPAAGGAIGVTLFFCLSGYLITSLLLGEHERSGTVDLFRFYARRGLRLLPAMVAVLAVVALIGMVGLFPADPRLTGVDYRLVFLGVLAYVSNWLFVAGVPLGVLGHTWSLAVEEQFYVLWPALLLLGLRMGRLHLGLATLVLAVAVSPWRIFLTIHGMDDFVRSDFHADALFFGCAVALLDTRLPAVFGWLGLAGLVAVAAVSWPAFDVTGYALAAIVGTLAVAGCPRSLGWAPLAWVGRISYGLYLWHGVIIWWALPWFVAVPLSIAVAAVSFYVLELPFLRLKDRLRRDEPVADRTRGAGRSSDPGILPKEAELPSAATPAPQAQEIPATGAAPRG